MPLAAERFAAVKIVMATSEAVPFAKTGGLADVCGALPLELQRLGHQVTVVMPAYRSVFQAGALIEPAGIQLNIPIGRKMVTGRLLRGRFPGSDLRVYFVDQPSYYDRDNLYQVGGRRLSRQLRAVCLFQPGGFGSGAVVGIGCRHSSLQ